MTHRLEQLLQQLWTANPFYQQKWFAAGVRRGNCNLAALPLTTRGEIIVDQNDCPPLGKNLTADLAEFRRFHQSSGTTGARVYWADTAETWQWVLRCSRELFTMAGVSGHDRIFAALPFGPSSGPWIIFEGATSLGASCLTAGNASIEDQAALIARYQPNVLIGKADHLLKLARTGAKPRVDKLILTGQNSFGAIRQQLVEAWGAECFDRYGLTEAGSVASECIAHCGGLHILDDEFVVECFDLKSDVPVSDGEPGELVITNLGRGARPIVRYGTGDVTTLVRHYHCKCGRTSNTLMGGVNRVRT